MAGDLEVDADLHVSFGDRTFDVTAAGSQVRVEIGALAPGRASLRLVRSTSRLARGLAREFEARALTLVVTRRGKPLVELGAGVRGGPLLRLLGLGHVRLFGKR